MIARRGLHREGLQDLEDPLSVPPGFEPRARVDVGVKPSGMTQGNQQEGRPHDLDRTSRLAAEVVDVGGAGQPDSVG